MALREIEEKKQKYHMVECINCRKKIKIPASQIARYAPAIEPSEEEGTEETSQESG